MFLKELTEKNTISVYGNGDRIIPQISVESLTEKISSFIKNPVSGTYNVADENIRTFEIAQRIIDKHGNSESKIIRVDKGSSNQFCLELLLFY